MVLDINDFNKIRLEQYPDPHEYKKIKERALWALLVIQKEFNVKRVTSAQIANFLTDVVEIDTSTQAINYAINSLPKGCLNRKNGSYRIMEKGRREILTSKQSNKEFYVTAKKPYSTKILFTKEVISKLRGEINICDPYINARLFDLLTVVDKGNKIRIITSNIEDKPAGIFNRALNDIKKEGYDIEVKKYAQSELHDRYIIDENNMWVIGHSIKDIGNKECFIINVGKDLKDATINMFNRRWKISQTP